MQRLLAILALGLGLMASACESEGPAEKAGKQIDEAVERNVQLAVRRLSRVPDLRRRLLADRVKIVGSVYDMHTGKVKLLE